MYQFDFGPTVSLNGDAEMQNCQINAGETRRKLKVFIVEDSPMMLERVASTVLSLDCAEVVGSASGAARAISTIADIRPDVVLLDLALAEGSGIAVLCKIREGKLPIYVVVLSNYANDATRLMCLELGANHFLDKSFEFDRLPMLLSDIRQEITQSSLGDQ